MGKLLQRFRKGKKSGEELDELEWMDLDDEDEIDDEEYEEDDAEYEDDDEEYEEDDAEYEDDDEEYDEDDDEYDDDEYEDEDDDEYEDEDDEEYEDEDDEEYEDDDYDDEDDEPEGGFGRVIYKLTHLPAVDYIVALTGVAVLVLAVITGYLYLNARNTQKQMETFAEIGVGMEEINMIGEEGLLAIADAQAAKLMAANMESEAEAQEQEEYQERETNGKPRVEMNLSSIQRDLKIKFVNSQTGKLISNVGFEVEITKPSGEIYSKDDHDRDGIIYQKDLEPGKYSVKLTAPSSSEEFDISYDAIKITVRDTIEYKKVDVADEVKTESQVNAAVEDTKVNETVVESTNTDTVEWVESTKTLIEGTEQKEESYEKVDSSKIADPGKKAAIGFRLLTQENQPTETPAQESTPTSTPESTEKPAEEKTPEPTAESTPDPTAAPTATEKPTEAPTEEPEATATPTIKPSAEPTATPTVKPSATPAATATPSASPKVTATPTVSPTVTPTVSPTATPNKAETDTKSDLKTTDGEKLYVKNSDGTFREAKYADFYNKDIKSFYRKITKTTGEYRYTGWQEIDGKTYFFDKNGDKVTGEQVIQGAKYTFNSDGSLNTGSGHLGIDVSKWNGSIDWNAVKNSGVSYVIIRCGYRGSTTGALIEDPTFRTNIKGALNAGLKVGVYFFTQATNEVEAVEEASMVLGLIKGYNISYPVFLDVESSNGRADGIDTATRTAVCKAFCQTIQNSGYKAGIYANKTWLNEKIDTPSLTGYKIWLAQYAAAPTYSRTKYDMWQYSSKGSVSGISGNVDMNISYMGY